METKYRRSRGFAHISTEVYYCKDCDSFFNRSNDFIYYQHILHIGNYQYKVCNICKHYQNLEYKPTRSYLPDKSKLFPILDHTQWVDCCILI